MKCGGAVTKGIYSYFITLYRKIVRLVQTMYSYKGLVEANKFGRKIAVFPQISGYIGDHIVLIDHAHIIMTTQSRLTKAHHSLSYSCVRARPTINYYGRVAYPFSCCRPGTNCD